MKNDLFFNVTDVVSGQSDVTLDDVFKLKLSTKKLESGKCQVKFYATIQEKKDFYGYVLVDSDKTLKDVVGRIHEKLETIRLNQDYQHIHLYSIGKTAQNDMNFIVFDA